MVVHESNETPHWHETPMKSLAWKRLLRGHSTTQNLKGSLYMKTLPLYVPAGTGLV